MHTVAEALALILDQVPVLPAERAGLTDALGRVLAEEVRAPRALPPVDVSQMDGYAVRSEDVRGASAASPARLSVVATSVAGRSADRPIGRGEAARVLTGAQVPAGADAVVMQEETRREGDALLVAASPSPGSFIRRSGADVSPGQSVLAKGVLVAPQHVGLLAALGRQDVLVHRRPSVALLATGDELVDLSEAASAGSRIVDSNSWALSAQAIAAGASPTRLGLAADDPEAIARSLSRAAGFDVVMTCAGVSVGDRDFVKEVLERLGVELRFWRVAMKPGKPLAFGVRGRQLFFALPGNPTSAMVSFEQFVRPALLKMSGRSKVERPRMEAVLEKPLTKKAGLVHFVRAATRVEGGRLVACPVARQDSGLVSSMAEANSLIVLPLEVEEAAAGSPVTVQLLEGFEG